MTKNPMIAIQLKFRIANIPFTIMISPRFRLLSICCMWSCAQALIEQSQIEGHVVIKDRKDVLLSKLESHQRKKTVYNRLACVSLHEKKKKQVQGFANN